MLMKEDSRKRTREESREESLSRRSKQRVTSSCDETSGTNPPINQISVTVSNACTSSSISSSTANSVSTTTAKCRSHVPVSERQQYALLKQRMEQEDSPGSPHGAFVSCHSSVQERKLVKRNDKGETALHIASKRGDLKVVKALIRDGAEVNQVDYAGWSPLHEAVNEDRLEVAKYLLRNGANVNQAGFAGQTALHDAVGNGNEQIVRLLMKFRADPYVLNEKGESPLCIPIEKENREKIRNILLGNISGAGEGESSDARSLTSEASSDIPTSCQDYASPGPDGGVRNSPRLTLKMSSSGNGKPLQGHTPVPCQISPNEAMESSTPGTDSGEGSVGVNQNIPIASWNKDPYAFEDEDEEDRENSVRGVASTATGEGAATNVGETNTNVKMRPNAPTSQEEFHSQAESQESSDVDLSDSTKSKQPPESSSQDQHNSQSNEEYSQDGEKPQGPQKKVPPIKIRISQSHSKVEPVSPQFSNTMNQQSGCINFKSRESDSPHTANASMDSPAVETSDSVARGMVEVKESRSATGSPDEQTILNPSGMSLLRDEAGNSNSSMKDCIKEELSKEEERTQRVGRTLRSHTAAQREREVKERMENVPTSLAESILAEELSGRKSGASSPATMQGSDCRDVTPIKKRKLRARGGGGNGYGQNYTSHVDDGQSGNSSCGSQMSTSHGGNGCASSTSGSGNTGVTNSVSAPSTSSGGGSGSGMVAGSGASGGIGGGAAASTAAGGGGVGIGGGGSLVGGNGGSSGSSSSGGGGAAAAAATGAAAAPGAGAVVGTGGGGGGVGGGSSGVGSGAGGEGHAEPMSGGYSKEKNIRIDLPSNPFHKAMRRQKELDSAREKIVRITPKQPKGYQDYLLITKQYITQDKTHFAQLNKTSAPDDLGRQELRKLFEEQENERYNTALRFQSERERLILFAEEEVLRANNRAARAIGDQAKPYSFCSMIAYNDLNAVPQSKSTVMSSKDDENVRDRFTYRTFVGWLQDSITEFEKLKKELLNRQMHEAEGLMMVQKMDWLKELKVDKAYDRSLEVKRLNDISSHHVPMVPVPSDFRVFQHDQL